MKSKYFVIYCLMNQNPPYIYKFQKTALNRCIYNQSYRIIQYKSQADAKNFFYLKKAEFDANKIKNGISILRKNLKQNYFQQKVSFDSLITSEQRMKREQQINEIFTKKQFIKTPNFKSQQFVCSYQKIYKGYFDGACIKGNSGPGSFGIVLFDEQQKSIFAKGQLIDFIENTNNSAQLIGLGFLLAHAYCNGIKNLIVFGDSRLAIQLVKGSFQTQNPLLKLLVQGNQIICNKFQQIQFKYISKRYNQLANHLASKVSKQRDYKFQLIN